MAHAGPRVAEGARLWMEAHFFLFLLAYYVLLELIAELGTVCRNQLRIGDSKHTFPRLTNTNLIQAKALTLLDVKTST